MKTLLLFASFAIVCTVVFGTGCQRKCRPDDDFKNGCNNCNCKTVDGEIVCSAKTCPQRGNGTGLVFKCKPGCTFKIDCNTCHCSGDGTSAGCTKIGCNVSDN